METNHAFKMNSANSNSNAIEIRNVGKVFEEGTEALKDVSFEVKQGEFISIVGASGCGKTTLLKMIADLITMTSGEIIVSDKGKKIGNIGMVFQSPVLLPWTTVTNNVMLPVDIYGLDKASYRERAQELIKFVGLEGFESRYPHQLSGGMQQRVSLCRALITDPSLLLMDEPFGALDALTRERMNLELLRIWSKTKKTVVFVTHSIPEAVFLSNRIVVMTPRPGRVEKIVEDNLKTPRDIATLQSPEFGTLCGEVRKLIGISSESSDLG